MIFISALTTSETISLVASIGAVISAMFSAVAAFFMWHQNWARVKFDVSNEISTDKPQNIYNPESNFAFTCISIHNLSPRPITISECFIEIDKNKIHALHQGMNFSMPSEIGIKLSKSTSETLYKENEIDKFSRIPIELTPFQSKEIFLLFPDFIASKANILCGKLCFSYGNKTRSKEILIHKLLGVD